MSRSPKLEQRRAWWRTVRETQCVRCFKPRPAIASSEFSEWEVLGDDGSMVCPDCITRDEQQAMDEADMATAETPLRASEADLIAGRLAAASQWFRLPAKDVDGSGKKVRDSTVYVEAEGSVINVCVTDADGTRREHRAVVQPINEIAPGVAATTTEGE